MSGTASAGSTAIRCSMRCWAAASPQSGFMEAAVAGGKEGRQRYLPNTAILETIVEGTSGTMRIVDFAPRFRRFGRMFRPPMLVRRLEPVAGRPRVTHPAAADLQLRRAEAADHQRQQPCALRRRCRGAAADHRRLDHAHPARERIRARPADHPDRRRRREHHRESRFAAAATSSPRPRPTGTAGCATSTSRSTGRRR